MTQVLCQEALTGTLKCCSLIAREPPKRDQFGNLLDKAELVALASNAAIATGGANKSTTSPCPLPTNQEEEHAAVMRILKYRVSEHT